MMNLLSGSATGNTMPSTGFQDYLKKLLANQGGDGQVQQENENMPANMAVPNTNLKKVGGAIKSLIGGLF